MQLLGTNIHVQIELRDLISLLFFYSLNSGQECVYRVAQFYYECYNMAIYKLLNSFYVYTKIS